jgi:L-ascorbate metabolism protein UlaG (beta-lactamase superfamily)
MTGSIRWLGVAFIEYKSIGGKYVLFDPWAKDDGNELCPFNKNEFSNTDLILFSHDHFDHIGSVTGISKLSGALVGGPIESLRRLIAEEGLPANRAVNERQGYLAGGGVETGWCKVIAVPAVHTSDTSAPLGTICRVSDGTTIYHAGDTAVHAEMEIFARLYPVDLAILPIAGAAMMDYIQAVEAVRMIGPIAVMPIHFDTWGEPEETLRRFTDRCEKVNPNVQIIKPEKGNFIDLSSIG